MGAGEHQKKRPDLHSADPIPFAGDLHAHKSFSKSSLKRQVRRMGEQ